MICKDDEINADDEKPFASQLLRPIAYSCRKAGEQKERRDQQAPEQIGQPKNVAAAVIAHGFFAGLGDGNWASRFFRHGGAVGLHHCCRRGFTWRGLLLREKTARQEQRQTPHEDIPIRTHILPPCLDIDGDNKHPTD